ncbi:MAG: 2-hydroxy-3-oxopropionate reductase [Deltaproteobacteria bacterium]|jgi:2-hydroxy-3-oxopropionate reductase|nr:2-hydroxy-3-oxopropionate reductase [Deltaproteobacteria bacterium]
MRIGFIGLGVMGLPMSLNLVKAGYQVLGFNRSPEKTALLSRGGGSAASSIKEVAESCQVIITMLPDSPDVREVCLGPGGIAESAKPGTLLIDMSSIAPLTAKEIHGELAKKSIAMIDAPVSGGEPKAINGTLSIMCGGAEDDIERARPVLEKLGSAITRAGEIGAGNLCKLANQLIVAVNIAAVGEALTLSKKAGLDPEVVCQAIRGGLAGSAVLEAKAPMMLRGDARPGFKIDLHLKDMRNVERTCESLGCDLVFSKMAFEVLSHLSSHSGLGQADHSAMVRYSEDRSAIKVAKQE